MRTGRLWTRSFARPARKSHSAVCTRTNASVVCSAVVGRKIESRDQREITVIILARSLRAVTLQNCHSDHERSYQHD
jgi:hypothetical protein